MQNKRKADEAAKREEARLLFQLAEIQDLPWQPADDGFVFSLQSVKTWTERHHRLLLAKKAESEYRKQNKLTEIARTAGKAA